LHFHGLELWPSGNGDNVLLSIPPGRSNRYEITISDEQAEGLYWYHPHIHGLADAQVYNGLAGFLIVGRSDGNYAEFDDLVKREMALRYNVVPPQGYTGELVDAPATDTYGTAMAPKGEMIYTVNGALNPRVRLNSADPAKGLPAESQVWAMSNITGSATYIVALDEVDAADADDTTVKGTPLDLVIVSIDGDSMPAPIVLTGEAAERGYLVPQGGRVAILVQGASAPGKVVRLLQVQNRSGTGLKSAYDWTYQTYIGGWRDYTQDVFMSSYSDYSVTTEHVPTPAKLTPNYDTGDLDLSKEPVAQKRTFIFNNVSDPSMSQPNNFGVDFKLYPEASIAQPRIGTVEEWTIYNYSPLLHPFHAHVQDAQVMEVVSPVNPDYVNPADEYVPTQYVTDMNQPEVSPFQQDVINIPPARVDNADGGMPIADADGLPTEPGKIVLRVRIKDFLGWYVEHCHRLPHEDRGMMTVIRSIPTDPLVATVSGDSSAVVTAYSSRTWDPVLEVTPFAGQRDVSVAVGDVNADAKPDVVAVGVVRGKAVVKAYLNGRESAMRRLGNYSGLGDAPTIALTDLDGDHRDDLVLGAGPGVAPRVVVASGATGKVYGSFLAYDRAFRGGVSVAGGMLEEGGRNSIVTGSGKGIRASVAVFNNDLFGDAKGKPASAKQIGVFKQVASYAVGAKGYRGGVDVAVGTPRAALGGLGQIVATTQDAGRLEILSVGGAHEAQMHHLGFHEMVSQTGVHLALGYQAFVKRKISLAVRMSMGEWGYGSGAGIGLVSTPTGARMLLAPARGEGPVKAVTLGPDGRTVISTTVVQSEGSGPAGM
ncbi:MAG: multicopper oxidase family protein, partial [Actinomycetota bacterium]